MMHQNARGASQNARTADVSRPRPRPPKTSVGASRPRNIRCAGTLGSSTGTFVYHPSVILLSTKLSTLLFRPSGLRVTPSLLISVSASPLHSSDKISWTKPEKGL